MTAAAVGGSLIPGVPVRVDVPAGRVTFGVTRMAYQTSLGTYVGPVQYEPSLSRVRVAGTVTRVPTEYLTVLPDPPAPDGRVFAARVTVHANGEYVIRWAGANRASGRGGTRAAELAADRHGLTLSPWRSDAGTTTAAGYALDWTGCPA